MPLGKSAPCILLTLALCCRRIEAHRGPQSADEELEIDATAHQVQAKRLQQDGRRLQNESLSAASSEHHTTLTTSLVAVHSHQHSHQLSASRTAATTATPLVSKQHSSNKIVLAMNK